MKKDPLSGGDRGLSILDKGKAKKTLHHRENVMKITSPLRTMFLHFLKSFYFA
tara:strand:- start:337 stop:495 length:159 start_codon:yes stop_codon:yes gene_type:complete